MKIKQNTTTFYLENVTEIVACKYHQFHLGLSVLNS